MIAAVLALGLAAQQAPPPAKSAGEQKALIAKIQAERAAKDASLAADPARKAVARPMSASSQLVRLGKPGGITPDLPAAVAATPEELVDISTGADPKAAKDARFEIMMFGTRAEILDEVVLSRRDDDTRSEGGYKVRVLEGPHSGLVGYVRGGWARPDSELASAPRSKPSGSGRRYARYHEQYEAEQAEIARQEREAAIKMAPIIAEQARHQQEMQMRLYENQLRHQENMDFNDALRGVTRPRP